MKVSKQELREHYDSLKTEELLELRQAGTLTELASSVMEDVLASRGITSEHLIESIAEVGEVEANLSSLLDLSEKTAKKDATATVNWRDTVRRSLERTSEAKAYCSRTVFKDLTDKTPTPKDHIFTRCRLDFVRPDRWHVTQEMWEPEQTLADEWITIGSENYQNEGVWFRTEDGRNAEPNQSLSVTNMLAILQHEKPKLRAVYEYLGQRYLLLQYPRPTSPELNQGFLDIFGDVKGACQIHIWISLETGFLAKGAILFKGTVDKELVHGEIHQAFASYNEDIRVDPPAWLNAVPSGDGLRIVNRKVPIVPHHDMPRWPATSNPSQLPLLLRIGTRFPGTLAIWTALAVALLVTLCTG